MAMSNQQINKLVELIKADWEKLEILGEEIRRRLERREDLGDWSDAFKVVDRITESPEWKKLAKWRREQLAKRFCNQIVRATKTLI